MNLMAGSLGGLFPCLSSGRLAILSVTFNNICNLRCRHCYLTPPNANGLHPSDWTRFFDSVFEELRPEIVCLSGKEPFVDRASAEFVGAVVRCRDRFQGDMANPTHIGVITNGINLLRHSHIIEANPPDNIDVSIDGLPSAHDSIRGAGAFAKLTPNLRWLARNFGQRTWITHTITSSNLFMMSEFPTYISRHFGLQRFSLGLYRPLQHTSPSLSVANEAWAIALDRGLSTLARTPLESPVELVLDLGADQMDVIQQLQAWGWINSSSGALSSTIHSFSNGLTVRINASVVPTGLWRAVRVSSDGYWLAAEDLVHVFEYPERALLHLSEVQFHAPTAYERGLNRIGPLSFMLQSKASPGEPLSAAAN